MFAWTAKRREVAGQTEADATSGVGAYAEARRRQQDTTEDAARWRRAAITIAKRTGKRIGLDTSTRMVADADMTAVPNVAAASRAGPPFEEIDSLDELAATIASGEH